MILVTGGAGFIGSNLVAQLELSGMSPLVVCDYPEAGGNGRNISKRHIDSYIRPDELFTFLKDNRDSIKVIFHLGATSSTMETDASLFAKNNYRLSLSLWRWCIDARIRFIYASSAATYGDGSNGFDDNIDRLPLNLLKPLNPYGRSKHLFDRKIVNLQRAGMGSPPQWAGLKFFNVYGPNEYHKGNQRSVVATSYSLVSRGKPVSLFKSYNKRYMDGGQLRDFIWVGDCVDVMLWLLKNNNVNGFFNIGTGKARSFEELANALFLALGREPRIEYIEMPREIRSRYQYFTEAKVAGLRSAGFEKEFTSLEAGVAQYVSQYLSRKDPYK